MTTIDLTSLFTTRNQFTLLNLLNAIINNVDTMTVSSATVGQDDTKVELTIKFDKVTKEETTNG